MKKLPIGTQSFKILRENNYLYIDKTMHILKMIENGRSYFLSRPRRFGKSLLLSTIEELYKGNKKLFKGLYIYDIWDWNKKNPVIKIDFGKGDFNSSQQLKISLNETLRRIGKKFSIELESESLSNLFGELIEELHEKTGKRIVVLIDEYDRAIIDNISNMGVLESNQKVLRGFYNVLKESDEFIELIFITGVSKFANMSIFSALNSPIDMTLDKNFASICGYTHQELKDSFNEYINKIKDIFNFNYDEMIDKLNYWYDGYSWDGKTKVYSPYSVLELFYYEEFSNYWFKTATPKFLIDVLKQSKDYSEVLKPILIEESRFDSFDYEDMDPITIFFQTGYLTIVEKKIIQGIIHYKLQYPNFEVESSLLKHLINLSFGIKDLNSLKEKIRNYIKNLDNEKFQNEMRILMAKIPSKIHIEREYYYQTIFLAWMSGLGFSVHGEAPTNRGFIDAILEEEDHIIIVECKFSKTGKNKKPIKSFEKMLNEGLEQIKNKKYHEKYLNKKIIMVAMAFAGKEIQTKIMNYK
jgi:hypothetical protein